MPRNRRFIPPYDTALHIMARGNNHYCLFANDEDKAYYLSALRELKEENRIDIFHYCLMSNHVHLIVWVKNYRNYRRFSQLFLTKPLPT